MVVEPLELTRYRIFLFPLALFKSPPARIMLLYKMVTQKILRTREGKCHEQIKSMWFCHGGGSGANQLPSATICLSVEPINLSIFERLDQEYIPLHRFPIILSVSHLRQVNLGQLARRYASVSSQSILLGWYSYSWELALLLFGNITSSIIILCMVKYRYL